MPAFKVSSEQKVGQIAREVLGKLEPFCARRDELFSAASALEPAEAAAQLDGGLVLSRFGPHDVVLYASSGALSPPLVPTATTANAPPTTTAEELAAELEAWVVAVEAAAEACEEPPCNPEPPTGPEPEGVYCARLRETIHVLLTRSSRDAFLLTPMRYALVAPPLPHVAPRAAVLGPAAAALAPHLAAKLCAVHVTLAAAVEWAVSRQMAVGAATAAALEGGGAISDEIAAAVLERRLKAPDALRRGWVLDNEPRSAELAALLETRALHPHRVYSGGGPIAAKLFTSVAEKSDLAACGLVVPRRRRAQRVVPARRRREGPARCAAAAAAPRGRPRVGARRGRERARRASRRVPSQPRPHAHLLPRHVAPPEAAAALRGAPARRRAARAPPLCGRLPVAASRRQSPPVATSHPSVAYQSPYTHTSTFCLP